MKCLLFLVALLTWCSTIVAEEPSWIKGLSDEALHKRGNELSVELRSPDSALVCYLALIDRLESRQPLDREDMNRLSLVYNNAGYVSMFYAFDYEKALEYLIRAKEVQVEPNMTLLLNLAIISGFYAQCFPTDDNIRSTQDYYRQTFKKAFAVEDWDAACNAYSNLWNFGFSPKMLRLNTAVTDSFALIPTMPDNIMYVNTQHLHNAVCYAQKNDYLSAVEEIRLQHTNGDNPESLRDVCQQLWCMVQLYSMTQLRDSTLACALRLETIARENGLKDFEVDAYSLLNEYYQSVGDSATAAIYRLRYYEKRDSLLLSRKLSSVRTNYLMHDLRNANRQVAYLEQERHARNIIITVTLAGILVAMVLLWILFKKNNQLKQRNRALYQHVTDALKREETELDRRKAAEALAMKSNEDAKTEKYQGSRLSDSMKMELQYKIEQAMADSEEICTDDFDLERLSAICETSYKNVSQVINETYGHSFSVLLSEYRIKEACKRINDVANYGNFTIEAIGRSVGFKARSGFFRAFKRVTGLTPSEYQKIANEQQK